MLLVVDCRVARDPRVSSVGENNGALPLRRGTRPFARRARTAVHREDCEGQEGPRSAGCQPKRTS